MRAVLQVFSLVAGVSWIITSRVTGRKNEAPGWCAVFFSLGMFAQFCFTA